MAHKLAPVDVLYMEDGGKKRCGRCVMALTDTQRCAIHGRGLEIDLKNGVCLLYVHGKPMTETAHGPPMKWVTPEVSGYGSDPEHHLGGYACGNCRYGGGPRCLHPCLTGFPIDNTGGCCNAWTEGEAEGRTFADQLKVFREG